MQRIIYDRFRFRWALICRNALWRPKFSTGLHQTSRLLTRRKKKLPWIMEEWECVELFRSKVDRLSNTQEKHSATADGSKTERTTSRHRIVTSRCDDVCVRHFLTVTYNQPMMNQTDCNCVSFWRVVSVSHFAVICRPLGPSNRRIRPKVGSRSER